MNIRRLFLLIFVAIEALPSCRKDDGAELDAPRGGITLELTVPQSSVVQTKAQSADEIQQNNFGMFTFYGAGVLQDRCKATEPYNATGMAQISLPEGARLNFYACANVSPAEEAKFGALVSWWQHCAGAVDAYKYIREIRVVKTEYSIFSKIGYIITVITQQGLQMRSHLIEWQSRLMI